MTAISVLAPLPVRTEPFLHAVRENFLPPDMYEALRRSFPDCPPSSGPTGFSLYREDDAYQQLLEQHPVWRALFDTFHSQQFIDWGLRQFAPLSREAGCLVDLSHARYVPYHEDRIDKERSTLRRIEHAPDELWVRLDVHQARPGYSRGRHRDHARRVMTLLLYFCDQDENGMDGGELRLHGSGWKRLSRPAVVTPRHNLMVAFPCNARSFHSVPEIRSMRQPRNYIQVHISSSTDVWQR